MMRFNQLVSVRMVRAGFLFLSLLLAPSLFAQDFTSDLSESMSFDEPVKEDSSLWQYRAAIPLPTPDQLVTGSASMPLVDFRLGPELFSIARTDLADLRIFDPSGQSHPFALRSLSPRSVREEIPLTEFNRVEADLEIQELALEMIPDEVQHNEIRIETTGGGFRRAVQVEASDDGKRWRPLVSGNLLRFGEGEREFNVDSLTYPDSRFRFIRIRVQPDPNPIGTPDGNDSFKILSAKVLRTVDVPGERSEWETLLAPREPTRVYGTPGSAWIIDLKGRNVPCDRIDFEVEDSEFARDVQIQIEQPTGFMDQLAFTTVYTTKESMWQRKLGDPHTTMPIRFDELQASRLRLLVTDYQNKPLTIRSATVSAAARQIVMPVPPPGAGELRLYAGNLMAEPPNYDFARNLPERLDPAPVRTQVLAPVENPDFVAPPLPFTERLPWLIYVVLATVCGVLLAIITSLARKAIAIHDRENPLAI